MKLIKELNESVVVRFTPQELRTIIRSVKSNDDVPDSLMDKIIEFVIDHDPQWMPYGTQKARTGDPYNWVMDNIEQILAAIRESH